jgi:hypothetical protein
MSMGTARSSLWALLCALPFGAAHAQQSDARAPAPAAPAQAIPSPEQLEPAVSTSPEAPPAGAAEAAPAAKPAAAPSAAAKGPKADKAPAHKGVDRVELGTTDIPGNRELPKVLYIVPWKRSDLGDLTGRPVNSLLDEVLQPLDRDVFQRENRYYNGLKPDQTTPNAGAAPAAAAKP